MGRGRAPCCAKVGLNKGSWTHEEDMRLKTYIHKHGHGNWRALPKHAGLLRCGKSCRLRWINYLRPDVKRGNFTTEEEDTIIKLHVLLGSKWSKIASCLPGRTDNEIKNVWNTHLKKRLARSGDQPSSPSSITTASMSCSDEGESKAEKEQIDSNLEINNNIDKVQIPVESNSSDLRDDPLVDLPDISIETEIWNMMNEDLEVETTKEDNSLTTSESDYWLEQLEKELDSTTPNFAEALGEGDPISSYFHSWLSSSSSLDLLY